MHALAEFALPPEGVQHPEAGAVAHHGVAEPSVGQIPLHVYCDLVEALLSSVSLRDVLGLVRDPEVDDVCDVSVLLRGRRRKERLKEIACLHGGNARLCVELAQRLLEGPGVTLVPGLAQLLQEPALLGHHLLLLGDLGLRIFDGAQQLRGLGLAVVVVQLLVAPKGLLGSRARLRKLMKTSMQLRLFHHQARLKGRLVQALQQLKPFLGCCQGLLAVSPFQMHLQENLHGLRGSFLVTSCLQDGSSVLGLPQGLLRAAQHQQGLDHELQRSPLEGGRSEPAVELQRHGPGLERLLRLPIRRVRAGDAQQRVGLLGVVAAVHGDDQGGLAGPEGLLVLAECQPGNHDALPRLGLACTVPKLAKEIYGGERRREGPLWRTLLRLRARREQQRPGEARPVLRGRAERLGLVGCRQRGKRRAMSELGFGQRDQSFRLLPPVTSSTALGDSLLGCR
mmetsp:Transcript_74673/g.201553  ORF Transcript_74673/g.201553 Transcript_74673/m.201553 type:complete len:452 (+) Transcript_74673:253-1608(+)